jgi:hypothetical protein
MKGKCKPQIQSDFMDNFIMDMDCKNTCKMICKYHLLVMVIGKRLHIGVRIEHKILIQISPNEQMKFRIRCVHMIDGNVR